MLTWRQISNLALAFALYCAIHSARMTLVGDTEAMTAAGWALVLLAEHLAIVRVKRGALDE